MWHLKYCRAQMGKQRGEKGRGAKMNKDTQKAKKCKKKKKYSSFGNSYRRAVTQNVNGQIDDRL